VVGQTDISNFLAKGGPGATPGTIDPGVAKMIGVLPGCNVPGCGAAFNASAGQADPTAKFALAGAIPTGSNPTVAFSKPDIENYDSGIGKIDHSIGKNGSLKLPYSIRKSSWLTRMPLFR
jgi:hypothetical protein